MVNVNYDYALCSPSEIRRCLIVDIDVRRHLPADGMRH